MSIVSIPTAAVCFRTLSARNAHFVLDLTRTLFSGVFFFGHVGQLLRVHQPAHVISSADVALRRTDELTCCRELKPHWRARVHVHVSDACGLRRSATCFDVHCLLHLGGDGESITQVITQVNTQVMSMGKKSTTPTNGASSSRRQSGTRRSMIC